MEFIMFIIADKLKYRFSDGGVKNLFHTYEEGKRVPLDGLYICLLREGSTLFYPKPDVYDSKVLFPDFFKSAITGEEAVYVVVVNRNIIKLINAEPYAFIKSYEEDVLHRLFEDAPATRTKK
jgi:hypothetical protein